MPAKFNMIGLFVKDIIAMVAFYRDVLGMDIQWDSAEPFAEFNHEGIRLAMYERENLPELLGKKPAYPRGINGTFELALNVGSPENVDLEYKRIVAGGASPVYGPRNEAWKMRSAMVTDPEGNLIEIVSDFWE